MARTGRPPKPTALKLLAPPRGRRVKQSREPRPDPGDPNCPDWLGPTARVEWLRIVPILIKLNLFTEADRQSVAAYCQAHAELVELTRIIETEGRIIERPVFARESGVEVGSVKVIHPALKMQRDAFARVRTYLGEFGLTPASRSKMVTPAKPETETDPIEELIRRGCGKGKAPKAI